MANISGAQAAAWYRARRAERKVEAEQRLQRRGGPLSELPKPKRERKRHWHQENPMEGRVPPWDCGEFRSFRRGSGQTRKPGSHRSQA